MRRPFSWCPLAIVKLLHDFRRVVAFLLYYGNYFLPSTKMVVELIEGNNEFVRTKLSLNGSPSTSPTAISNAIVIRKIISLRRNNKSSSILLIDLRKGEAKIAFMLRNELHFGWLYLFQRLVHVNLGYFKKDIISFIAHGMPITGLISSISILQ